MSQLTTVQTLTQELAATTIQRIRRGYIKRNELNKMEHAALRIQRLGRNYLARKYNNFKYNPNSAPDWLKNNRYFILAAVNRNGYVLKYASAD